MNAKTLILIGILLIIAGLWWQFGSRYLPLGHLPGDIAIKGKNFRFYFPITSSIIVSIILTVFLYLVQFIKR